MLKLPSIAAFAAPGMFSMMPRERSCRPRWATGRAISQSGARTSCGPLRDLENSVDLDRRVRGKRRDADGGAGVAALVAERRHHQVGGAVQNLRAVEKIGSGIDKTAEPNHALQLFDIADLGLDLCKPIEGANADH